MWVPALVAILRRLDLGLHAAARELGAGRAGHRLDLRRDARDQRHVPGAGIAAGRRVVEAVDIGQQHQQIGAHHGGDAGGQPVVVAIADFVGGDGVVLVDDRDRAPLQQRVDGRARIQIAPPLLGVAERHQHLAGGDAVPRQRLGPGARQRDLADRRGGLAVFELERTCRQLEHGAAERDRAGGDDQHVALVAVELGDVGGQRRKPRFAAAGRRGDRQARRSRPSRRCGGSRRARGIFMAEYRSFKSAARAERTPATAPLRAPTAPCSQGNNSRTGG